MIGFPVIDYLEPPQGAHTLGGKKKWSQTEKKARRVGYTRIQFYITPLPLFWLIVSAFLFLHYRVWAPCDATSMILCSISTDRVPARWCVRPRGPHPGADLQCERGSRRARAVDEGKFGAANTCSVPEQKRYTGHQGCDFWRRRKIQLPGHKQTGKLFV